MNRNRPKIQSFFRFALFEGICNAYAMKNIIFLFFLYNLPALGQVTFNKTYNNGIDASFNVLELKDGYLTAAENGQPIYPQFINFIKTDLNGDTVFQKQFGTSSESLIFYSLKFVTDSAYIAGCVGYDYVQSIPYLYLVKLNVYLDTLWTRKIFADPGFDYYGVSFDKTSDGGYIVTGQITDTSLNDGNLLILKTDSNGIYQWRSEFGGLKFDAGMSSVELADKGFLTLGWTRSLGFGNSTNHDFYLVKTDSMGNFKWQKTYGTPYDESGIGVTALADGNYLLAGNAEINQFNVYRAWIIKIDTAGNIIWQKQIGTSNLTYNSWWARELPNHTIVATGSKRNAFNSKDEGWITLLDANGNQLWDRSFGMNNNHAYFRDVQLTSDGGFICAGFCFVGASGNQDAWLVKLDSLGCDSAGCANYYTGIDESQTVKDEKISIYPNPASEAIFIRLLNQKPADTFEVSLFNSFGSEVLSKKFLNSGNAQPVDVRTLVKGLYIVKVKAGEEVYGAKLIIE
jgi:hypothetical protein